MNLRVIFAVAWKEFSGFFLSPVAYIVISLFLILSGLYGFMLGNFIKADNASLIPFFEGHSWVYLILIPALGMQMWSEERRAGTFEMLFTLPVRIRECVIGKYLAGLGIITISLILTFPTIITVFWLGEPDLGAMICGYMGSFLIAATYLSIASLASACSKNQIISLVLTASSCLLLNLAGMQNMSDLLTGRLEPVAKLLSNIGIRIHYVPFVKGIVDTRHLIYFILLITLLLAATITVLWIKRTGGLGEFTHAILGKTTSEHKHKIILNLCKSGISIFLFIISLCSITIIGNHFYKRYDFTVDQIFTIHQHSINQVKTLKSPVVIRLYLSREKLSLWPAYANFAKRVEDTLNEYMIESNGQLIIEKMDPQPRSLEEESASLDGIEPHQVESVGRVYMGIAMVQGRKKVVLPTLEPTKEAFLEYDITRALHELNQSNRPTIGLISALPVNGLLRPPQSGGPLQAWLPFRQLLPYYNLKVLESQCSEIPQDISTLILAQAEELSTATLYAVDQFLMRGGKLVLLADPNSCYVALANYNFKTKLPDSAFTSDLNPLISSWGITINPSIVAADLALAYTDRKISHPCQLVLTGNECIDFQHPITEQLKKVMLLLSGFVTGKPVNTLTKTVLLKTTENSAPVSKYIAQKREKVFASFKSDKNAKELAILLEGKFPSAFPNGKPQGVTQVEGQNHLSSSAKSSKVVVIADVDFIYDPYCQRVFPNPLTPHENIAVPINDNVAFFTNVIDFMENDYTLLPLRSEKSIRRPFTRLKAMEAKLEQNVLTSEKELMKSAYELDEQRQKLRMTSTSPEKLAKVEEEYNKVLNQLTDLNAFRNELAKLENSLIFWNITIIPAIILLFGFIFLSTLWQMRRPR